MKSNKNSNNGSGNNGTFNGSTTARGAVTRCTTNGRPVTVYVAHGRSNRAYTMLVGPDEVRFARLTREEVEEVLTW